MNDVVYTDLMVKGMTMSGVFLNREDEEIIFYTEENRVFILHHYQNCCETVYIEDIVGDLQDLVGRKLEQAEIAYRPLIHVHRSMDEDSSTWSYVRFRTIKGSVVVRFFGSSNGYYSETAEISEIITPKEKFDYLNKIYEWSKEV